MFTNKGKTPDTVPALPDQGARRSAPSRLMTSIIANGVRIIGTVEAEGAELQVDGEIDGNVRGGSLTVGDTGSEDSKGARRAREDACCGDGGGGQVRAGAAA